MNLHDMCKVAHETNRLFCEFNEDFSQPTWENAPDWMIEATYDSVATLIENPHYSSKEEHDRWKQAKLDDGWVYGEVKDAEKKTHPCLVEYDELPRDQKFKDYLRSEIVRILATLE